MKTVARGSRPTTTRASKRPSQSIFAPASRAPCEATNRPWTWKIGRAWISTSPPAACASPSRSSASPRSTPGCRGSASRPCCARWCRWCRGSPRGRRLASLRRRVDVGEVGRALEQAAVARVAESEHPAGAGREGELRRPDEIFRLRRPDAGLGIAEEIAELVALVSGVERQVDMAGAQHRKVEGAAPRPTFPPAPRPGSPAAGRAKSSRLASIPLARSRSRHVRRGRLDGLDRGAAEVRGEAGAQRGVEVGVGSRRRSCEGSLLLARAAQADDSCALRPRVIGPRPPAGSGLPDRKPTQAFARRRHLARAPRRQRSHRGEGEHQGRSKMTKAEFERAVRR